MRRWLGIAETGVASVLLHPLRSWVTVACVVSILLPFLAGLGISRGLRDQAEESIRYGADLYVTGRRLGRNVPIPLGAAATIRALPGVTWVQSRIVGEIRLGAEGVSAVLVGLDARPPPEPARLVHGRLPVPSGPGGGTELLFGSQLARRLGLEVGSMIPPFYRNDAGERVMTVVGIFQSDLPVWEANLVFTTFETAAHIFAQKDLASSFLVSCAPKDRESVRNMISRLETLGDDGGHGPIRPSVATREDLAALLPRGLLHREGVFDLHFLLAFAVGIPLVLVTTGVGLTERRKETGLLKATGWQTDEVCLRALVESLVLAVAATSIAILLAYAWLRVLHGWGIAGVFLSGVDAAPGVQVPFRLMPVPVLLTALVSFVVVMTGTLASTWKAASTPPSEALR